MKMNKSILALALALSAATIAKADVYMTGSTAMRGVVYNAIVHPGTVFQSAPTFYGFGGAGSSDNYMAFSGTLVGGSGTTVLYCNWTGSEDGIAHVAQNTTQTFIDSSLITGTGSDPTNTTPTTTQTHTCDLAMGDNDQPFSRTTSPILNTKSEVGIITFEWVRNNGTWSGTGTNVTASQIRQALNGGAKLAVFTGNVGDTNSYVYVSGRDSGSGTRVNAFGTSGFGILTSPKQIELSSGVMQILTTSTNIHTGLVTTNYIGDYGFSSGGTLAKSLGASTTTATDYVHTNGTGFGVISYLGVSDANTAIGSPYNATALTFEGVPFTPANVIEGSYTYWGNEFIYENNAVAVNSDPDKIYNLLIPVSTGIPSFCDGVKAISLAAMHCTRNGPTTDPVHN